MNNIEFNFGIKRGVESHFTYGVNLKIILIVSRYLYCVTLFWEPLSSFDDRNFHGQEASVFSYVFINLWWFIAYINIVQRILFQEMQYDSFYLFYFLKCFARQVYLKINLFKKNIFYALCFFTRGCFKKKNTRVTKFSP